MVAVTSPVGNSETRWSPIVRPSAASSLIHLPTALTHRMHRRCCSVVRNTDREDRARMELGERRSIRRKTSVPATRRLKRDRLAHRATGLRSDVRARSNDHVGPAMLGRGELDDERVDTRTRRLQRETTAEVCLRTRAVAATRTRDVVAVGDARPARAHLATSPRTVHTKSSGAVAGAQPASLIGNDSSESLGPALLATEQSTDQCEHRAAHHHRPTTMEAEWMITV